MNPLSIRVELRRKRGKIWDVLEAVDVEFVDLSGAIRAFEEAKAVARTTHKQPKTPKGPPQTI